MKKLFMLLSAIFALGFAAQEVAAADFVPEDGVKYVFRHKDSPYVLFERASDSYTVLATPKKSDANQYEVTFTATDGGYYAVNGNGHYLYRRSNGYDTMFKNSSDKTAVKLIESSTADDVTYYRIVSADRNLCVAPDAVGEGEQLWFDKALTSELGEYEIIKASDMVFNPAVTFATSSVAIQKDADGTNSAALRFTINNVESGTVTLTASEGFTVEPATVEFTGEVENTVTVTSAEAIGAEGTITVTYNDAVLGNIAVSVVEPYPCFYIFNQVTGLVIGGDETPVLAELTLEDTQKFQRVPVEGSTSRYYLVQKSSGKYLRNVSSGEGVYASYCDYGDDNGRIEWQFPANGDGVSLKNTKQDRILIPVKNEEGSQLMLYGTSSDEGSVWTLEDCSQFGEGDPTVEIANEDVVVEQDGITFTTEVRAYNLGDGNAVTVVPSEGVNVSVTTLENSFKRSPITISTSNPEGTECYVNFVLGDQVLKTLNFTVVKRFNRYIAHLVYEGETDLVLGTEADSTQPILAAYNEEDNTLQTIVAMPVGGDSEAYYLLQEGSYGYLSHKGNGWSTEFGANRGADSQWTIEVIDEADPTIVQLRGSKGLLDADSYTEGSKLYCNKSKGTWRLSIIGVMETSVEEVNLADADATATVTVTGVGLPAEITVTTTGAATVSVETLPAEGGDVTVGLDATAEDLTGTVVFTSGSYTKTINVRLSITQMQVDKTEAHIVGKGGFATIHVSATDIADPIVITTEGDGFNVSTAEITADTYVESDVTVTYSGSTETTGKVIFTCGSIVREVAVSVEFNPDITISTEGGTTFDNGIAYFSVTATDLFDVITITASDATVAVEPAELPADADDEYVFLTAGDDTADGTITVTLTCGDLVKTVDFEYKKPAGINDLNGEALAITANAGIITVKGATRVIVADIAGRVIADTNAAEIALAANGVYVVTAINAQGNTATAKVVK